CDLSLGGQPAGESAGGAAAVRDRILLRVAELGHGAAVVTVVGDEGGVVAEPALTARLGRHGAGAAALEHPLLAAFRVDEGQRAGDRSLAACARCAWPAPGAWLSGSPGSAAREMARRRRRQARTQGGCNGRAIAPTEDAAWRCPPTAISRGMFPGGPLAECVRLGGAQALDAARRQGQQVVEVRARERGA